jgi:TatD DNase family protein
LYDTRGADLDEVIDAAHSAGVTTMINVGCDRATTIAAIDIAARYDTVWATVGLHPHEAQHGVDSIRDLFDGDKVVAVGECGLDYFYDHSPRHAQRAAFAEQIAIACERRLPLVIHTRDAWNDTFDVLTAEGIPEQIVFHCFTGGPSEAHRCIDLGGFVSFSGIVTFKTAADIQDAARWCPDDHLLIETDSPYLAPVPHRGTTNRPAHVAHVAEALAALRGVTVAQVAALTSDNARHAFPRLAG